MDMNRMMQGAGSMPNSTMANTVAPGNSMTAINAVEVETHTDDNVGGTQTQEVQVKGSKDMLKDAIAEANKKLTFGNNECEFRYHEEINRVSIKVINRQTKEVIREIPSQETIEMLQKLQEMTGLLVDEKR